MRAALLAVALLLAAAAPASAAPELVKLGDFTDPVHIASPPGDPRVFVVEQAGTIDIVGGGTFLDLTSTTQTSYEQGLLSMAFSPDYATSGRFFVFLTSRPDGDVEVLEYRVSADPNRADPNTRRELFSTDHAADNHNGGQLQIGPDGALYASIGDNAVPNNAQDNSNPFGKILRIDPNTRANQIWSYGLRNPWRFSFDRATGDLVIGDVGSTQFEEINWSRAPNAGQGVNYGWPCNEGPNGAGSCGQRATLWHDRSFCAIVGGYVVRDPGLPTLNGRYLYGDNCNRNLYSAALGQGAGTTTGLEVVELSSFGEDSCGHLYAAARGTDAVYRIQDGAPSACGAAGGPGGDTAAPAVSARILRPRLKRRQLRFAVRCDEACRVAVSTRLRRVRNFRPRERSLAANTRRVVQVKLNRRIARKLRRTLQRRGFVRLVVTVRATDAAGNSRAVTKRGRIRRR